MKKYNIIWILIFLIVEGIVIHWWISENSGDNYLQLTKKQNTVILGDSHALFAFNALKNDSIANFAQTAELYPFTYFKLKALKENNSLLNKVYLSVGEHNFAKVWERNLNDEEKIIEMINRYRKITPEYFFKKHLHSTYIKNYYYSKKVQIPIELHKDEKSFFHDLLGFKNAKNNPYTEEPNWSNDKTNIEKTLTKNFGDSVLVSNINVMYLDSIIVFCAKNNISLILFKTPTHHQYEEKINAFFKANMKGLAAERKITIWRTSTNYDQLLMDADHLNKEGSKKFIEEFLLP